MTEANILQWVAVLRRGTWRLFEKPPFAGNELSPEDCEAEQSAAVAEGRDPTRFAYFRFFTAAAMRDGLGHYRLRCFRVPKEKAELFEHVEQMLDLASEVANLETRIRETLGEGAAVAPSAISRLSAQSINLGWLAASVGIDLQQRSKSRPKTTREKLTDPKEREAAESEIKKQIRGRRVSWTAATNRASAKLRDIGIRVSGKLLREKFSALKPDSAE